MSNIDEIKKIKKLLDDGIITEEDFNNQKKRILGITEEKKTLDDYEQELLNQSLENETKETIPDDSNKVYEEERAKEKARLDALDEKKRERNAEISKTVNDGVSVVVKIIKWILTAFCLLIGIASLAVIAQNPIVYLIMGICFILLGLMACPKITDITKEYESYTKHKALIAWILFIIMIIVCALFG